MKTFSHYKPSFFKKSLITMMSLLYITTVRVTAQTPLVGSLGGSVEVAANGMATYSIPIEVVPGTCGVQPALSVVYSSAGGRGLLGSCWDLAGLSSVTRIPRSHFYDGDAGSVNFDASDRYALDGARLIRLSNGAYSSQGAVYGKEAEDFTRVTLNGTPDNGAQTQWFSAVTADGTVAEYGHNADSKQTLGNNTLSWWMDRVTDPEGNYMTVEYTGTGGETVPYRIRYTGNSAAGLNTYAKVILNYTTDPNPNRMWVGGQYTTVSRLLSSVDVYYLSTLVRRYVFEYTHDRSTRLTAVVLKDASGAELTRTAIAWGADGTTASVQTLNGMQGYSFVPGDFNGDNLTDLFFYAFDSGTNRTNWSVRRGDGSGQFSSLSGPSGYIQGYVSSNALFALDIEGDGIDDIGYIMSNVPDDSCSLKALHFRRPGTGYSDTTLAVNKTSEFHIGDFLGSGEIQAVTVGQPSGNQKTVTCTRNGASFAVHKDSRISVTDLNGNGKSDIQVVKDHDIDLYEYDASAGGFVKLIDSHYMTYTSSADYFGDLNGDGNLDYIYFAPQGFFLRVSKGNDYAPSQSLPFNNLQNNEGKPEYPLFISDLNGDGKDDIIQADFNYNTQKLTLVTYLSRGLSGSEYRFDTIHFHDNAVFLWTSSMYHFSDMNGDGQTDLFYSGSIYEDPVIVSFPERRGHDLVSSFTDGFGKTATLRYCYYNTPSTQGIGRDGRRVRWPLAKRVAEPDGVGGTSVTWHTYYNAVHDRERRQTLGFEQHETYLNGTSVREEFLYDGNCHRLALKQCKVYYWVKDTCALGAYIYDPDIGSLDRRYFFHHVTINTPAALPLAYGRFVPYNTVSSEVNRLENTKRQTRTWLRADGLAEKVSTAYGKASVQSGVDPVWVERDSAVYSYTAVTVPNGSQVMKLSGEVARHRRHGYSQTPAVTTLYSYSSAGRLDSVSVCDLDGRVGATAYTYNACGLPLTVTYTPAGMAPLVTSFEYDSNGRFVTCKR